MRRVCSIVLYVIAGFVLCMVATVSFIRPDDHAWVKWLLMGVFLACALVPQCLGLALYRFRNWRRDSGIVLLSSAGYTGFGIFTIVCVFMDKEVRSMMKTDPMPLFSDYLTGGAVLFILAAEGWMLYRSSREQTEPDGGDSPPPADSPN